ncbi:MAG: polysaccharide pyruvyl transferase family protein [Clostridia bacterium]|nr:polysaccharide pyruvyl transferase family protein [Clostridia bacterium]
MKLGIISINAHTKVLNPASPLHSYVFQQFLKENGYDSTIIDYKPVYYGRSDVAVREPLVWRAQRPGEDLQLHADEMRRWALLYEDRKVRFDKFKEFVDTHYVQTDKCYTPKLLDEEDPGFDCYLCVTDIIWKDNPVNGFDKGFTLASKCMDGKKKIAYTASRGAHKYHPEREQGLLEWVADFDFISVRESSFKEYLDELLGKEVPVLCDPIFLMGQDFYEDLAKEPDYKPEKDFAVIYLAMNRNDRLVKLASDYAARNGLELIELSEYPEDADLPEGTHHKVIYDIGPDEWLWYLLHSTINFTNSFHACCLSMICRQDFISGFRGGDKVDHVLNMFDLSHRKVHSDNVEDLEGIAPIDFDAVQEKIRAFSKEGADFVLGALRYLEDHDHKPFLTEEELADRTKALADRIEADEKRAEAERLAKEQERQERLAKEQAEREAEERKLKVRIRHFLGRIRRGLIRFLESL